VPRFVLLDNFAKAFEPDLALHIRYSEEDLVSLEGANQELRLVIQIHSVLVLAFKHVDVKALEFNNLRERDVFASFELLILAKFFLLYQLLLKIDAQE